MTGLLILLAAIFTGCSCYYLSCAFADIPTVRTSKAMMTTRKQTGSGSEKLFDVYLTRIARLLAPVIRLDPVKRGKLQTTLEIAELSLTPEAYTAKAGQYLRNQRGDFYISDGVKIIIAVVLGALLLAALTTIFNDTVIPRITQEIEGLFS